MPLDEEIKDLIAQQIPALRRYGATLAGMHGCDDLVQDTLLKALRKSHTWRREGSIKSWLFSIMYRSHINNRTKASYRKEEATEDMGSFVNQSATSPETQMACREALEMLADIKSQNRDALLLVSVEGFSYDEAAHILAIPVSTLRSRIARGRLELRAAMDARRPAVNNNVTILSPRNKRSYL